MAYRVAITRKGNSKAANWYAENETQCTSREAEAKVFDDKAEAQKVAREQTKGSWKGIVQYIS